MELDIYVAVEREKKEFFFGSHYFLFLPDIYLLFSFDMLKRNISKTSYIFLKKNFQYKSVYLYVVFEVENSTSIQITLQLY